MITKNNIYLIILLFFCAPKIHSQCGSGTPTFTANLTATPNGTWISPPVVRNDTCCGWTGTDVCIKFVIYLNPASMGINFGIASGAAPSGALYYSINCGPPVAVGTPICLSGAGPHTLTFCKPGNNQNTYSISAIPAPVVPDSILVRNGCTQTLSVSGFSVPTINWNSVGPGPPGAYNSYLNCVTGCATVVVTPTGTPPPFVDYEVSGYGQSPCQAAFFKDTVRVYYYSDLLAGINPTLSTICFGSTNAVLTGTASGGLPPYTYSWSPGGSTGTVVTVGPGTYTFFVGDNTGCPPTTATAVVNQYTLPIAANAGPDKILCKSSPTVVLSGTVTNATGGTWSGGSGTFAPTSNSVATNYIPTAGEVTSGVQLYLTTTGNSGCPPKNDTINISFQNVPLANAGPDFTVCANNSAVSINGVVSGFSSTGTWSTTGSGVFSSTTSLNTTYTASPNGASTGSVNLILTSTGNGVCPPARDTLKIFITPSPTVNAGPDQLICSNSSAALTGSVTGPTSSGLWTTTGDGAFFAPSQLNTSYTPGPNDILTGTVNLVLSSTGNGNCLVVKDTMKLSIKKLAVVVAGSSQTVCSTTSTISLSGGVSGGVTTGSWTGGGGSFSPSNIPNTTYNISAADVGAGVVVFTLTAANNAPCPVVTSTTSLSIVPLATVNAGPNQYLCSTAGSVALNGSILGATTWSWSSSSAGTFLPGNFVTNPTLTFTASDVTSGFITFTLTSTNNGVCPSVSDSVKIAIAPLATVSAGPSKVICSNTASVNLIGSVTGVSSNGLWSTSGSGAFNPPSSSLNTNYFISVSDLAAGTLIFTLTSTANGPCPAVTDTMKVVIVPMPSVNSGPNQYVCANAGTIALTGIVNSNSNGGVWTTSGGGSFSPNNISLNPLYAITPSDASNGAVTFTLSATGNSPCPVVSDTVKIKIKLLAQVNAGPDLMMCSSSPNVPLTGTVAAGSTSGVWNTNGSGNFSPANSFLNCTYNASPGDITNGSVLLVLTSTNNDVCPAVSDTTKLTIIKKPVINLLSDTTICAYQNPLKISASLVGGSGNYQWSTSGSGTFGFAGVANAVNYSMTAADISSGFVSLTINSINNGPCGNLAASIHVVINPAPNADFTPSTYTANIPNDPIQFTNQSTGANSYYWNFGDGGFTSITSPIHNYLTVGYYNVSLVASNEFGCKDTAIKEIKVISDIQFPNVFTPNLNGGNGGSYNPADLSNDVFFPYTSGVTEYHLRVFNRWGELIFESTDIQVGWDGYFNGKLCQQDAYVWKADVKFFDGRKYNKTGNVTLLR